MKKLLHLALVAAMLTTCVIPASASWEDLFGFADAANLGDISFDSLSEQEQYALYDSFVNGQTTELEIDTAFLEGASDWAEEELFYAYCQGMLDSVDSLLCDYQNPITRLEFCQLVVSAYKAMGGHTISTINPFTDTADPNVVTAYALGIVTGTTDTTFSPNDTITREQIATMVYRAIKIFIVPQISNDISVFADADEVSDYALDAVTYLNQIGAMLGTEIGLEPQAEVTREQSILIAYRAVDSLS